MTEKARLSAVMRDIGEDSEIRIKLRRIVDQFGDVEVSETAMEKINFFLGDETIPPGKWAELFGELTFNRGAGHTHCSAMVLRRKQSNANIWRLKSGRLDRR